MFVFEIARLEEVEEAKKALEKAEKEYLERRAEYQKAYELLNSVKLSDNS